MLGPATKERCLELCLDLYLDRSPDKGGEAIASEAERRSCLAVCHALDTAREEEFDRLVRLARAAFGAPIALISFVDAQHECFKAEIGLGIAELPRASGFGHLAIASDAPLVIADTAADPRLSRICTHVGPEDVSADTSGSSPDGGMRHVRAYAGAPLVVAPGVRIGTIAVCDTQPRAFTAGEVEMLVDLARVAVDGVSLRRAKREAENLGNQLHAAIEALPDGFMLFDETDRLVLFNRRMTELYPQAEGVLRLGITYEELFRKAVSLGWFPAARGCEEAFIQEALAYHRNPVGSMEQPVIGGGWLRISETKTATGATVGFRVDISELKRRESELFELATRDALTGVLSRRQILDDLERELARARRYGHRCAILLIDADHFKQVNDRCGHQVGDEVLKSIAARISSAIRETDHVGRLGGEEFVVVLADTDLGGAMETAERLRRSIEEIVVPVRCPRSGAAEAPMRVTVSIGVAQLRPGENADDLYARADASLYGAKASGRNCVVSSPTTDRRGAPLDFAG